MRPCGVRNLTRARVFCYPFATKERPGIGAFFQHSGNHPIDTGNFA